MWRILSPIAKARPASKQSVANTGIASIPFVGWVLAGAATMIGMDQGAEIGGNMVEDLNKNC